MSHPYRARRSCLSVPASSERFIASARRSAADFVFLDLEDSVAAGAKGSARSAAGLALSSGPWQASMVGVRINDASTPWAFEDVLAVAAGLAAVEAIAGASSRLEALVFGPADFMASVGMRSLEVGAQPEGYVGGRSGSSRRMRLLRRASSAVRSCSATR